jgi:plastocyanin
MRKAFIVAALAAVSALPAAASAEEPRLPIPEPGVVGKIAAINDCVAESEYDVPSYYGADCRRLQIVFGPIVVKPGANDVLVQPVTFEKPMWDGYMVRFKPGLIGTSGYAPPVEQLHLHHGTWLNAGRSYGTGPWLATGEEKTIAAWPNRYGLEILGSDAWLFLHMVHSAVTTPTVVWATYDIDYVESSIAETVQADGKPLIRNTRGIWLDVGGGGNWSDGAPNDDQFTANPVYNVQTGFGGSSANQPNRATVSSADADAYGLPSTALDLCAWPDDNCARENSSGNVSRNQGNDVSATVEGWDFNVNASNDGSLVVMGGHLHMGGTNDTVSLVREFTAPDGVTKKRFSKVIHISDAYYWNWDDPTKLGAAPISWDVSMSGVSKDMGWSIRVKQGDKIRLNADYDTSIASWYENMGIVMTWVAPGDTSGLDPFRGCTYDGSSLVGCAVTIDNAKLTGREWPEGRRPLVPSDVYNADGTLVAPGVVSQPEVAPGYEFPGAQLGTCSPSATVLCTRGQITHGHIETSGNHGGCRSYACPSTLLANAPTWLGDDISEVHMSGFLYAPGDFGQIGTTGIPTVALGDEIRFVNEDMNLVIPHTATACAYPCTAGVSTHYPLANAAEKVIATPSTTDDADFIVIDPAGDREFDTMDFDTTQIGVNVGASQNVEYTLKTTRTGVFTYFCRIHPFMRGAFEVYDPAVA